LIELTKQISAFMSK